MAVGFLRTIKKCRVCVVCLDGSEDNVMHVCLFDSWLVSLYC